MAEVASLAVPLEAPERDYMNRPPKITQDDADELLARGPYQARLAAARRTLEIAMRFSEESVSLFPTGYIQQLQDNVAHKEHELDSFRFTRQDVDSGEAKQHVPQSVVPAELALVRPKSDFLARKAVAVCSQVDPELFFPEKGGATKPAKKICRESCDLEQDCLSWALEKGERHGVWGGKSESERRKLAKGA